MYLLVGGICKEDTPSLVLCHGDMITYFVDRQICDSMSACDVKSIDANVMLSQKEGIDKKYIWHTDPQPIYVHSICLPEMCKDHISKANIVFWQGFQWYSGNWMRMPNCKAPTASCKHVAALCYTLDGFLKNRLPNLYWQTSILEPPQMKKSKANFCSVAEISENKLWESYSKTH